MTVEQRKTLDDDLLDAAWALYHDSFVDLNDLTAQRHLMSPGEFKEVMADDRVTKFVTFADDVRLVGLATFTNDLDAVPLIAPQFYARRWPVHYAQRRIWYIGFVAVAPHARGLGAFAEVFEDFYRIAAPEGGLIGLDMCQHNVEVVHLFRAITIRLAGLSGGKSTAEVSDTQSFLTFDMCGDTIGAAA